MKTVSEFEVGKARKNAADYFGNGFHCAEAVVTAVLEALDENSVEATSHATAFGGGFGRTYQEACGALSGALIVIGHLYGRQKSGDDWDVAAELGAAIRQSFLDEFKTTHCATLRCRFGKEQQMAECRKLTAWLTAALLMLLAEISAADDASEQYGPTNNNSQGKSNV